METIQFLLTSLCLFIIVLHKLVTKKANNKLKLPPSPPKLPILGNLHQLGKLPHRSLRALSNKYGPLMLLQLGHRRTLVVSSSEGAREIMKNHDIDFSNRDQTVAANIFLHGCVDLGFAQYGEYWRQVRKICALELLSLKRVQSFQFLREEEVSILIDKIREACLVGVCVNLSEMFLVISNNIIARCAFGRKAEKEDDKNEFGKLIRKMTVQFTEFSFGDNFPVLGWMDYLTGLIGRLKSTAGELDACFDQVIEEHRNLSTCDDGEFGNKDFVHILSQLQKNGMQDIQLNHDHLRAILLDMFAGGTETSSTTMEWLMSELIRDEKVMKKAQEETRRVVGDKLKVEVADIQNMNYLKCIIKETLRLHPVVPFLLPRQTSANVQLQLGGYYIPSKTRVLVNTLAIHTDPKLWENPEQFYPERFENNPVDFIGQDFQFIPFGGGRRSCPGILFGLASIEFVIANLLYWFDWKLPDARDLDMTEQFGLTVSKKIPLQLLPSFYSP